jgi:hypothetical protein
MSDTYKIVRFHRDSEDPEHRRVIKTGLTLEEAQDHCNDDATHEYDDDGLVVWFDGYDKEA